MNLRVYSWSIDQLRNDTLKWPTCEAQIAANCRCVKIWDLTVCILSDYWFNVNKKNTDPLNRESVLETAFRT